LLPGGVPTVEADPGAMREPSYTEFFGFCVPALLGMTCPIATRPTKPAIAVFNNGNAMAL